MCDHDFAGEEERIGIDHIISATGQKKEREKNVVRV